MGTDSAIEWTDHTWNPWQGCTRVSAGCANCYMYRGMERWGRDPSIVTRSAAATFRAPLAQTRRGTYRWAAGSRVFVCSWSDWFHPAADPWRAEAWEVIQQRPDLVFIVVTKRPQRIQDCLPTGLWASGIPANVWVVATVERQGVASARLGALCAAPVAVRGVSYEPGIGPLDLRPWLADLDWVIVGGESGPGARPFHVEWADVVVGDCQAAGVPVFVKQLGSNPVGCRIRDPRGANPAEWPARLRVRQYPERVPV